MSDFTTTFSVQASPERVFSAINDVRAWWAGDVEGPTDALGGEFTYRFKKLHYTRQKVTELVPGSKVVWHVTDCNLNFVERNDEWKGTDIVFEIRTKGDATEVRFTHVGLVPAFECYDACRKGWTFYLHESLRKLAATGKGEPREKESA